MQRTVMIGSAVDVLFDPVAYGSLLFVIAVGLSARPVLHLQHSSR